MTTARLVIGGKEIAPGKRTHVEIDVARLPTYTDLSIPVMVVRGKQDGPRMWLSAAIHGDELNGVEIIRRVLERISPKSIRGTLIAVPIVNVFGFLEQSRYLPDRRDLNRSFPGSTRGSLAARIAKLFMSEIVSNATHGIDLHTASVHRANLPQVRADLDDEETRQCAEAFGPPVALHAKLRDGSLREAAANQGTTVLLYEAGEAQRFNRRAIDVGVRGVLQVMAHLGMTDSEPEPQQVTGVVSKRSRWIRARVGGLLRRNVQLGDSVQRGDELGYIADAFGEKRTRVRAQDSGLVIGMSLNPVVHQGDALIHVADS